MIQVLRRGLNPDHSVTLVCEYLLAEDTVTLTADAGDISSGVRPSCYFPNALYYGFNDLIVDGGRIFAQFRCDEAYGICSASTNIPTKISQRNIAWHNVSGFYAFTVNADYILGVSPTNSETPRGPGDPWWPDLSSWLYQDWVYRYNRTNLKSYEILKFTEDNSGTDIIFTRIGKPAATDSTLYLCGFKTIDVGMLTESTRATLTIVDLADFTLDAAVDLQVDALSGYSRNALQVHACGDYLLVNVLAGDTEYGDYTPHTEIIRYNLATDAFDGGVVSSSELGIGVYAPDGLVYYLPRVTVDDDIWDASNTTAARVDPQTLEITYFDLADDPDFTTLRVSVGQPATPWADKTYLYFLADNYGDHDDLVGYIPAFVNAPRLCRRLLSNLSVAESRDLTVDFDNTKWQVNAGACDDRFHYMRGYAMPVGVPAHRADGGYTGCLLKVAKDFTYSLFYPAQGFAPFNDDFPGFTITAGQTKKFTNEFATKQEGEPDHFGNPGGNSIWYTFAPKEDGRYRVSITGGGFFTTNEQALMLAVYVGSAVQALTFVRGVDVPDGMDILQFTDSVDFDAFAALTYRIVIDGFLGTYLHYTSEGKITLTRLPDITNDNFANATNLGVGQTVSPFRTTFATKEPGEPDHGGEPGGRSAWWKITITDPDMTTLRVTTVSDKSLVVGVYTGEAVDDLTEIASGSDGHTAGTLLDYAAWVAAI